MNDAALTSTDISKLHKAARWYAKHGLYVFPVHSIREGHCTCRQECASPGKHPRTKHGFIEATTDVEQVDRWWGMWPDAGVAIACGPSGLAVIDVDIDKGGDESLRDLEERHALLPETARAITGGGGSHIIFKKPQSGFASKVSIAPGLDTRGDGGYIVAAPSGHESGGSYVWEVDHRIGDLPLAEVPLWFLDLMQTRARQSETEVDSAKVLGGLPEGDRDWEIFRFAARMRQCNLPIDVAYELCERAAANCRPPFNAAEARKKVDSAYRYPAGQTAIETPEDAPHRDGLSGAVDLWPYMAGGVPEPEWVITGILLKGMVTMLHGEPGCGKTILSHYFARELARAGLNVMFIDEESGPHLTGSRLAQMGLTQDEASRITYYPFAGITVADTDALIAKVDELKPAAVFFDSMADMMDLNGLDENKAGDVGKWMKGVAVRISRSTVTGPSVCILDHNTKDQLNTSYARGSGAKKAKLDIAFSVHKVEDFDAETMGSIQLRVSKNRLGFIPQSITFVVGGRDGELVVEPFDPAIHETHTRHPSEQQALDAIVEAGVSGLAPSALQAILNLSPRAVTNIVNRLINEGSVARTGATNTTKYIALNFGTAEVN